MDVFQPTEWSCDHDASTSLNLLPINKTGETCGLCLSYLFPTFPCCSFVFWKKTLDTRLSAVRLLGNLFKKIIHGRHGPKATWATRATVLVGSPCLKNHCIMDFFVNSKKHWMDQVGQVLVCFGDVHLYKKQNLSTQCSPCWIGAWRNALCRVALVRSSWLVKDTSKWPVPQTCGSFPGVFPAMTTSNRPINWCHVPPTEPQSQRRRLDSVRKKLVPWHPKDTLFPIP